jgi:hypothetical protein
VLALLLTPAAARADRHDWEANASASAASGSQLWGGNLSVARTIHIGDSHKLSAFADYSKHGGEHDGASLTQTSALIGLRRVMRRTVKYLPLFPEGKDPYHYKLQFFLQAAPGVVKTSSQGTHAAALVGAGLDWLFSDYGGVRTQVDHLWFWPDSGRDHFFRFSVGVLYRFEREHKKPKAP